MKKSLLKLTALLGLAMVALAAYADQQPGGKGMDMGNMTMGDTSAKASSMAEGEVKAVDPSEKSITLKHGPIKSKTVEMGPMTMSFPVQQPAQLSNIKAGDKVKFIVENINGTATVTSLERQK